MRLRLTTALFAGAITLIGVSLPAVSVAAATTSSNGAAATAAAPVSTTGPAPDGVQLPALVSQTPVSYTPNVYEGSTCGKICHPASTIDATVFVNGEVVVAGAFTQVCSPVAGATYAACTAGTVPADYIFAFNPATGAIDPSFTPVLDTGPVYALAAGPNDTVYAGGGFKTVNGVAEQGLAQFYVTPGQSTDGQLVPGFAGHADGSVKALAYNGNALYVGGQFGNAGKKQQAIARLNATTGAFDKKFAFTLGQAVSGKEPEVGQMSLSANGSLLVIGGTFQTVNGTSIPRIALINTGGALGATATLDNWSAPILTNNCSSEHDYVEGLDLSPDGSFFVVDATGYMANGQPGICDAAARFDTGDTGNDVQPTWINYTGGDTLRSVAIDGNVVYIGGHQRWANNECGNNYVCESNAVLVDGVAAVDASTGLALPWWHPQTARGVGVQSLTLFPAGAFPGSLGGLLLGTDVGSIGGAAHQELAMFPMTTSTTPVAGGPIPSGMYSDGRIGGLDESTQGIAAQCVDDAGNATTAGSPVELVNCANDNEQNWTIDPDQTIEINGLCLDTSGDPTASGTPVDLNTCDGATSQQWQQGAGDTVLNQAAGLCLDDPGNSTSNGTQLDVATCSGAAGQSWPLPVAQAPPAPPATGSLYPQELQRSTAVPCATDKGGSASPGAAVILQTCLGQGAQNWTMATNGTITVKKLCMDTQGEGTSQGTLIVLATCNGSPTQQWTLENGYELVNQASGECLDDPGLNTADGVQLQIYSCNGGNNQQWRVPTY
jgi:hypothetical protein